MILGKLRGMCVELMIFVLYASGKRGQKTIYDGQYEIVKSNNTSLAEIIFEITNVFPIYKFLSAVF